MHFTLFVVLSCFCVNVEGSNVPKCSAYHENRTADVWTIVCNDMGATGATVEELLNGPLDDIESPRILRLNQDAAKFGRLSIRGAGYTVSNGALRLLTELKELEISGTGGKVQPNAFSTLNKVETFRVDRTQMTSDFKQALQPLRNSVKTLKLQAVNMRENLDIVQGFVKVEQLTIYEGQLEQFPRQAIQNFAGKVKELELQKNNIRTLQADDLTGLTVLTDLNLNYNQLEAIDNSAFGKAPELKRLRLAKNRLANLSPEAFRSNTKLNLLALSENPVRGLTRADFNFLPNLTHFFGPERELVEIRPRGPCRHC